MNDPQGYAEFITAVWLILVGVDWLGWITINIKFLGLVAFVAAILWLVHAVRPDRRS